MKRIFFAIFLSFVAILCGNAQSLSSLSKAARLSYVYLQDEGYKPRIDEDQDVVFKAQGYSFYVDSDVSDNTYLRIVMPTIKNLGEDAALTDLLAALAACNDITREKKLVKASVDDDGKVSLSCETYIGGSPDISEFVDTAIDFMIRVYTSWHDKYKEYLD
jgi:hypothetical protein